MRKTLALLLTIILLLGSQVLPAAALANPCLTVRDHVWVNTTWPATCTETGLTVDKCSKCGQEQNKWILAALGHDWGGWTLWPEPTCTKDGTASRVCKRDASHKETQVVPAIGGQHAWQVTATTPAGCETTGLNVENCTKCAEERKTTIPALGHEYGEWVNSFTVTCEYPGTEIRFCIRDIMHPRQERTVPALGHIWECTTIKTPTCSEKGEKRCVCTNNAKHMTISEIPMTEHKPQWVQSKAPTSSAEGERQYKCQVCNKVLKVEALPKLTRRDFYNNTMCSLGLRFRDVAPKSTEKWYMFTPLDLSQEGEQRFPLIASDAFVVGTMTVAVKEGLVTVNYQAINGVEVSSEYLTFYPDLDTALAQKPDNLDGKNYAFGQAISIADDLAGDTSVLLLLANQVSYHDELSGIAGFSAKDAKHAKLIEEMEKLMARE